MKKRAQPRTRTGARIPTGSCLVPELRRAVDHESRDYGVSRSWIVAVALARHFGVRLPASVDYRTEPWSHKPRRRK